MLTKRKAKTLRPVENNKIKFSLIVEGECDFNYLAGGEGYDTRLRCYKSHEKLRDAILNYLADAIYQSPFLEYVVSNVKKDMIEVADEAQASWKEFLHRERNAEVEQKKKRLAELEAETARLKEEIA